MWERGKKQKSVMEPPAQPRQSVTTILASLLPVPLEPTPARLAPVWLSVFKLLRTSIAGLVADYRKWPMTSCARWKSKACHEGMGSDTLF